MTDDNGSGEICELALGTLLPRWRPRSLLRLRSPLYMIPEDMLGYTMSTYLTSPVRTTQVITQMKTIHGIWPSLKMSVDDVHIHHARSTSSDDHLSQG